MINKNSGNKKGFIFGGWWETTHFLIIKDMVDFLVFPFLLAFRMGDIYRTAHCPYHHEDIQVGKTNSFKRAK